MITHYFLTYSSVYESSSKFGGILNSAIIYASVVWHTCVPLLLGYTQSGIAQSQETH